MIAVFRNSSEINPRSKGELNRRTRLATISTSVLLGAFVSLLLCSDLAAQSAGCNRARLIVDQLREQHNSGALDHHAALQKLRVATQLCPTLGEAWTLSYCSALALGDEQNARIYRDRAIFNSVAAPECRSGPGVPAADTPRPLPGFVRDKYALVIGVGSFRDPAIPSLQFTAKDASDFAAALRDPRYGNFPPENVTVLVDEKATRAAILNAMQELFLKTREEDLVVIYVSSHGSPARDDKGLSGIGYIVTHDTSLENIWVDAIEYQNFAEKASLLRARRKVIFLDTCFSGQASRPGAKALFIGGMGVDERTAKMFLSGEGTFVITSSKASQQSWEGDTIANSYFTYYLIEALKRSKEPPTVREIFDYLSHKVAEAVSRDKGAEQHPQMHPATGPGDVRIGVIPQGPLAVASP